MLKQQTEAGAAEAGAAEDRLVLAAVTAVVAAVAVAAGVEEKAEDEEKVEEAEERAEAEGMALVPTSRSRRTSAATRDPRRRRSQRTTSDA